MKNKTIYILKFEGKIQYIKSIKIAKMILRIEPQAALTRTITFN